MDELTAFVKEALGRGLPRPRISEALASAGWPKDEVADALSRFADLDFPIPVPKPRQSGSARDAFLYLVTFFALYVSAFALGSLAYGLIEHLIPDPAMDRLSYNDSYEGLRWSVSSLIVAFPVYFGLMRKHIGDYRRDPERRSSPVRRWLTYLTLFVAATVVIGTLIATISEVLGGELAARFLAKSAAVLLISGGVFVYYLQDMRPSAQEASR